MKILVENPSINLNIKDNSGDNALNWCIDKEEIARVLLESGKINIEHMKGVENYNQNANGSFEFQYYGSLIKMNSRTSLHSIE